MGRVGKNKQNNSNDIIFIFIIMACFRNAI